MIDAMNRVVAADGWPTTLCTPCAENDQMRLADTTVQGVPCCADCERLATHLLNERRREATR